NSHYAEDQVVPQRLVLSLSAGGTTTGRTVTLEFMSVKSGINAYDSLATWNFTQTSADRCQALPNNVPCPGGAATTFAIKQDPSSAGHEIPGDLVMYGGMVTAMSDYSQTMSGSATLTDVTITYEFAAGSTEVMLLWGGHLAAQVGPRGWGIGLGAAEISGEPFHMRTAAVDGAAIGNRDNQITA